jgi:Divergent InlB B-repeat domain
MKGFVAVLCVLGACVVAPASAVEREHGFLTVWVAGSGKVTSSPPGIDCPDDCYEGFSDPIEDVVTLHATPSSGSTFEGWTESECDEVAGDRCTVVLRGDTKTVGATFGGPPPDRYGLAVSRTAGGTVSSEPGGINCGTACTASFAPGSTVTLTATPDPGLRFSSWGAWCSGQNPTCVVTMDAAKTVAAYFGDSPPPSDMPLIVSKSGSGTVASSPAGIACEPACAGSFPTGTTLTLTASAASGWTFGGWGGDCSGTGACALTMDGPKSVTAAFRERPPDTHALSVVTSGEGRVASEPAGIDCDATCSRPFLAGSSVTLHATPAPGWRFVAWRGACSGTGPTCGVVMDLPKSATAAFAHLDQTAPTVRALRSSGRRGRTARLRYRVSDDSGRSRVSVTVYRGRRALARIRRTHAATNRKVLFYYVSWRVPRKLAKRPLRFCVAATDSSGNGTPRPSCAVLRIS